MPRNHAASKIGNGVISLLWQLRCHCNPDNNNFSSLSNTTVVSIFPNLCLWRRSLRSNVGGIDPEKLYRATLTAWLHAFQGYVLKSLDLSSPVSIKVRRQVISNIRIKLLFCSLKLTSADARAVFVIGKDYPMNPKRPWRSSEPTLEVYWKRRRILSSRILHCVSHLNFSS